MYVRRHYTVLEIALWTRYETAAFLAISSVPAVLHAFGVPVTSFPWQPIAVLGTAVAFVTGFKGNSAYGRLWEARTIWGAIVNASRTWLMSVRDFHRDGTSDEVLRPFVLRHVAWLTALRHQLREPRVWETTQLRYAKDYMQRTFSIPERCSTIESDLAPYLAPDELAWVLAKKNRATAIASLQSAALRRAFESGALSEYRHVELMRLLATLVEQQGRCERIKNFPYPRQFATLNQIFVWLFVLLLPFGIATELERFGDPHVWMTVPIAATVSWVFHTMDKIGDVSENPFEGGPNDVPVSTMSRAIEIDLLDLLDQTELPAPIPASHCVVM